MSYVTVSYSNPFTNPINKVYEIKQSIDEFNEKFSIFVDKFLYWINPLNWFIEANKGLYWLVNHPETGNYLIVATIVGFWFMMLGANFPKKWLFWGWIGYWVLRALIYNY